MAGLGTWLYQRIVDESPEAIVVADPDGVIQFWNHAAEDIFGYAAADVLGHSLDVVIPEPQRERHWAGYHAVMRSGQTRYGRDLLAVPAVRKNGARISVEFHVVLLRDEAGEIAGIAALIRDVTAHWQRDRAMQQRLRALEAEVGSHPV